MNKLLHLSPYCDSLRHICAAGIIRERANDRNILRVIFFRIVNTFSTPQGIASERSVNDRRKMQ
jgi:hypothetical protein